MLSILLSKDFGAKVAISLTEGYVQIDRLSWENFNESTLLQESVERYREQNGYYPEAVLVDKLYRPRENIRYCQERGIRISGPRLGRPRFLIFCGDIFLFFSFVVEKRKICLIWLVFPV